MITPVGYIDVSTFTAYYLLKYKHVTVLREEDDAAILKEWKSARALLTRIKNQAAEIRNSPVILGRVSIETLDAKTGTQWATDEAAYSDLFMRLRIPLIAPPGCWTFSGLASAQLAVGQINVIENRLLYSEVNHSEHPRTHLIVDITRPNVE